MNNEFDLKIGDCFPSRESLIEKGYHNHRQRGMGTAENENGIKYIYSIVMSDYPDNKVDIDDIYYSGEGGFNPLTGKIEENQSLGNVMNKRMQQSIKFKTPILFFQKLDNKFCFKGRFIPTHYKKIRGVDGFEIIDFHLIGEESYHNLIVSEETKEVHVVFDNAYAQKERKVLTEEDIKPFIGLKISNRVGGEKIFKIVN